MENKNQKQWFYFAGGLIVGVLITGVITVSLNGRTPNGSKFEGNLSSALPSTRTSGTQPTNRQNFVLDTSPVTCTQIRRYDEYNELTYQIQSGRYTTEQINWCKRLYPDLWAVKFAQCKAAKKGLPTTSSVLATCNKYYSAFMSGPDENTCKLLKTYFDNPLGTPDSWTGFMDKNYPPKYPGICAAFWPEVWFGSDQLVQLWYE